MPGRRVRMTEAFRERMRSNEHGADHEREFGDCVGVVIGPTAYPGMSGPEVDVRWQPSGLRYAYDPADLEAVS